MVMLEKKVIMIFRRYSEPEGSPESLWRDISWCHGSPWPWTLWYLHYWREMSLFSVWRYNLSTLKCTHLRWIIWWVLKRVYTHETLTTVKIISISITLKSSLGPLGHPLPSLHQWFSPGNHWLASSENHLKHAGFPCIWYSYNMLISRPHCGTFFNFIFPTITTSQGT